MRLLSTTIAGPSSAATIGQALRSVAPFVDACLVVITCPDEGPILTAIDHAFGTDKVLVDRWPWRQDFGAARNAALGIASDLGADWALTIDSDEWVEPNGEDIRATIEASTDSALYMRSAAGGYWQPRAIRLPCSERWSGRTHEAIALQGGRFATAAFAEHPKTPEQYRVKFERDVAILNEVIAETPTEARWHYYHGDALQGLGRHGEAIDAFRQCAHLSAWGEQAACASFRAADLLSAVGRNEEAIDACAFGMSRNAGMAELPWIAALASFRCGRYEQAVYWARLAMVHGKRGDPMALESRIGFRWDKGLDQGPREVLALALNQLGKAS